MEKQNTRYTYPNLDKLKVRQEAKIAPGGKVSFRHSCGVIPEVDTYIHI